MIDKNTKQSLKLPQAAWMLRQSIPVQRDLENKVRFMTQLS